MKVTKSSRLLCELVIQEIPRDLAKTLIVRNHYSKKWNTAFGVINIGNKERS